MQYIEDIKLILKEARQKTYQAINTAMVEAYWKIGQQIVLEEQNGQQRATYVKEVIKLLSKELSTEFGRGYSKRSLSNFRKFYITFPDDSIWQTLSAKLSWSHLRRVLIIVKSQIIT